MGRHLAVGFAVVTALILASAAYGVKASTVAQYRSQANAICDADQNQLSALPSGLTLAQYLTAALKVTHTALTSLQKLTPPSSLAKVHAQLLVNIRAGFPIVERLLARAKAGKLTVKQFQNDKGLEANVASENALWGKVGATHCAG